MSFRQITHPDDIDENLDGRRRLVAGEISTYETEKRYLHADGHVIWTLLTLSLLRDDRDAPLCFISHVLDISARKAAEAALQTSERQLTDAQEVGGLGSWEWEIAADRMTWSEQLCRIAGLTAGEHPVTLAGFTSLIHEDDRARTAEMIRATPTVGASESQYRFVRPDGEVRWVQGRRRAAYDAAGQPVRLSSTIQDITARLAAEHALRDAEERFRRAFDHAPIGMALVSLDGSLTKVNDALCGLVGHATVDLTQRRLQDLTHPLDRGAYDQLVAEMLTEQRTTFEMEKRYVHADGHVVWVQLNLSLARDSADAPMYFIAQIQDITERKSSEAQLEAMARRDHLTGLYNRRGFEEELTRQLAAAGRDGYDGAVLLIDLDGFKTVNDSFGHQAGDALLAGISGSLSNRLRASDLSGRIGGDEFAVALPRASMTKAGRVANEILEIVRRHGRDVADPDSGITASIGVTRLEPTTPQATLLHRADRAMYQAKQEGGNRVRRSDLGSP